MAKLTLTDIAAGYALIATINANNAAIEAALENTLSRDGTTPNTMSAALDMNSQFITNLPTPTANSHAATKDYVDTQITAISAASGTFAPDNDLNIGGSWDFEVIQEFEAGLKILDSTLADDVTMSHDGTDFNEAYTGTTDKNVTGLTAYNIFDGAQLTIWDSTDTDNIRIYHDGTDAYIQTTNTGYIFVDEPFKLFGGVYVDQQAAAGTDEAGFNQLWARSTDGALMHTDAGGTNDTELVGLAGSFTAGFSGFSVDPAATVYYRVIGDVCHVMIDPSTALGTSNATSFTITGMPTALRPATNQQVVLAGAIDNGSNVAGATLEVQSASDAWLLGNGLTNVGGGGWTGSGSKGFATTDGFTFSYLLNNPS